MIRRAVDFALNNRLLVIGLAIILFAPLFLGISLAVKLTSEGPVFFRQRRVGQHGKSFIFLKFRSMFINNDPSLHQNYVLDLIAGQADFCGMV